MRCQAVRGRAVQCEAEAVRADVLVPALPRTAAHTLCGVPAGLDTRWRTRTGAQCAQTCTGAHLNAQDAGACTRELRCGAVAVAGAGAEHGGRRGPHFGTALIWPRLTSAQLHARRSLPAHYWSSRRSPQARLYLRRARFRSVSVPGAPVSGASLPQLCAGPRPYPSVPPTPAAQGGWDRSGGRGREGVHSPASGATTTAPVHACMHWAPVRAQDASDAVPNPSPSMAEPRLRPSWSRGSVLSRELIRSTARR